MSFDQPRAIHPCLIYGMDEKKYEKKWQPDRNGKQTTHFVTNKTGLNKEYPFYDKHSKVDIQIGGNHHISPRDYGDKEKVEYLNHHFLEILNIYAIIGWDMEFCEKSFQINCPVHCHFLTDKQTTAVKKYLSLINDEKLFGETDKTPRKKGFG